MRNLKFISRSLIVVLGFLQNLNTANATGLLDLGRTVQLGDISYFVPGTPEIVLQAQKSHVFGLPADGVHFVPVTHLVVNNTNSERIHSSGFEGILNDYGARDDVWNDAFANYLLVSGLSAPSTSPQNIIYTSSCSTLNDSTTPSTSLPSGPYFAQLVPNNIITLYRAYRLYPDPYGAFYYGVLQHQATQNQNESFTILPSTSPDLFPGSGATLAVPSRLYFPPPTPEYPLSGIRIGVKDIYNLADLKTSAGSRAYFSLYPSSNTTAPSIQYLLDLGAVVIGKTRTSQFANGESPTADWVDFHDPFNPRGDGYQDPSSSSAGAGAATAGYEWLDMNIGSDTGGSVRAPAAVAGVFGVRPSFGIMTLEGVVSLSKEMDTPGFMARSAEEFASWGKAWYGKGNESLWAVDGGNEWPGKLVYPVDTEGINTTMYPSPGFFPVTGNEDAAAMYEKFTQGLEEVMGIKRTVLDFYTVYKDANGLYPPDQLGAVWSMVTSYEQYHSVLSPLMEDWSKANAEEMPYFDPPVKFNRDYGQNTTAETFAEGLRNKTIFQNWLRAEILIPEHDTDHCSSSLLVHPIWPGTVSYRDNYPKGSPEEVGIFFGWNQYSISQLGGVPEVVLPLGQVRYQSRVTETEKYLPVAVSINAAEGCDFLLYNLVEELAIKGVILKEVTTGSTLLWEQQAQVSVWLSIWHLTRV